MTTKPKAYYGQNKPPTDTTGFNAQKFLAQRVLAQANVATLVKVAKVTTTGEVAEVGRLDAQPLVNMIDGIGQISKHGTVYNLCYLRQQSAEKAIIMDPKAGDIGLAVFCDRDISVVKKTKAQAQPGSRRRNDMADGVYIALALGSVPTCYLRFTDDDQIVLSPDNGTTVVTIKANSVTITVGEMQAVVTDQYAQLKWRGHTDMHFTVNKPANELQTGKATVIAPDPNPGS